LSELLTKPYRTKITPTLLCDNPFVAEQLQLIIDEGGDGVQAEAVHALLGEVVQYLKADDAAGQWVVVAASLNNPFSLTLEGRQIADAASPPSDHLLRSARYLERGERLASDVSDRQMTTLLKMAQTAAVPGRTVRLLAPDREVEVVIDPAWVEPLRSMKRERASARATPTQHYSLIGLLDAVNVHGQASEFFVFDPLHDHKTRCDFADDQLEKVRRSLGERVRVAGRTSFDREAHPIRMSVESIAELKQTGSFGERLRRAQARRTSPPPTLADIMKALEWSRHGE